MTRREFAIATPAAVAAQPAAARFEKGICSDIFPRETPVEEMFASARNAGFRGVEMPMGTLIPLDTPEDKLARIRDAAAKAQCEVVSLWCSAPLSQNPLNSPDPAKRAAGVAAVRRCLDICAAVGAKTMLLVPGRLGDGARFHTSYEDTWNRVTTCLRELIPYAAQKKVCITPENVWNKFLVSPLEMRSFVDQFKSPWFQMQFDTGNIMQYGYPQDWIRTLGPRIRRLHLKDYKLSSRAEQGRFVPLLEGDVDWKEVMKALVDAGYRGFACPEYGHNPQEPDQLKKISQAVDKILALA